MKNRNIIILLAVYLIISILTIWFFNGTGDDGDSVMHYLFAKYAPKHPELFFDHWAKPVYVLLSFPFAQAGFNGIKFFNVLVSALTIFITYRTAGLLKLRNQILVAIFLIFSPLYYVLTFSGLTEPLFALFVILGLFFILKEKPVVAAVIISFLPFVRSEGLIIAGVFGLYFIFKKQLKLLLVLLAGHIVYSIAGFFVYHDILWVFTKIPYNNFGSPYGSGSLLHFFNKLVYVTGVPIYILFWSGFVIIIFKFIRRTVSLELVVLVFLGFSAFFAAHSLFWYFGIFNSMGLKRVLIGVIPLISIISLVGFNFFTEHLIKNQIIKEIVGGLIVIYVLIFPFLKNPASINWKKDMMLSEKQQLAKNLVKTIDKSNISDERFVFAYPYLSEAFDIDYFDKNKRVELTTTYLNSTEPGDMVVWDNWFAKNQRGVSKTSLDKNPELINLKTVNSFDNKEVVFSVYRAK